jgi:hypothetical protein
MITIAPYFWHDPTFANSYKADDIRLLKNMVARNITVPYEFAVITDQPELFRHDNDIRAIPIDLSTHIPGTCFARLMTFHPEGAKLIGERVLQIDIDTVITGNLDEIVSRPEPTVLWRNPTRLPWDNPMKPSRSHYNTSVVLHQCGLRPSVWRMFNKTNPGVKDDQWWLSKLLGPDMPYFSGANDGVYRIAREDTPGSGINGSLPKNARIVTFPGSNGKAHLPEVQEANPWIKDYRF